MPPDATEPPSRRPNDDTSQRLRGTLERIRFQSDSGEFSVAEVSTPSGSSVTIVGNLFSARPGESVEVDGSWQQDRRFGLQFRIDALRVVPPTTREGVEAYLSSGFIEGIGPVLAGRIVAHFGAATLDVLDADPERIREVDGIGEVRARRIGDAWEEQRQVRGVMVFLQSHGVSPAFATRIWKQYGARSVKVVREQPYKLAQDIRGIGFRIADDIALRAGLLRDSAERLRAGLLYALREAHRSGHVYLPIDELQTQAAALLDVPMAMLGAAIQRLGSDDLIVVEPRPDHGEPAVFLAAAHRAELGVAEHLRRLLRSDNLLAFANLDQELALVESDMGQTLADAQRRAALTIWHQRVAVVTGGPGTGKTTIIRAVCALAQRFDRRLALCAPTGRAAKRMTDASGIAATTVHRLLEYAPHDGGFTRDQSTPVPADLVIVDEASMLDIYLAHALLRALPSGARLLLVGDVDQLPSVGPGSVLGDIIASQAVSLVRLTEVFRQAQESTIVRNAHRINQGFAPLAPTRREGSLVDFYTINADSPERARERVVELVTNRIPQAFGVDPFDDIQVLSPMHRGPAGCQALNQALQAHFAQPGAHLEHRGRRWHLGDKVMQTRNNYERDVFNGDIGRVCAVDPDRHELTVDFDGRRIAYPRVDLDELMLAYAITVHKSQGSEYPVVVMPVVTQHYVLLQRNLLYTAVTRARRLVVLVGSPRAVEIAVDNDQSRRRFTSLDSRLRLTC